MLVQACPAPAGAIGAFTGSPYCGLAAGYGGQRSLQDRVGQHDANNGNRDEVPEEEVDNRELRVESDLLVTESQVLDIETTITETFTTNSNEILGDFGLEALRLGSASSEEGGDGSDRDFYSDRFERAFECGGGVQEMAMSTGSPASSCSSLRSRGRLEPEPEEVHKKSW
jgi:hypothetical protein